MSLAMALLALQPLQDMAVVPVPEPAVTQTAAADHADAPAPSTDIVVTRPLAPDPAEAVNIKSFEATQAVDKAVFRPVATAYKHDVPHPVRIGVHNFLKNVHEPVVALNYVLQIKLGKAAETVGRFAINSTLGVAGLVDVARKKPFNLPRRPNGFADTLGYYGVGPGTYFYVPLAGPTTVRDALGTIADGLVLSAGIGTPFNKKAFAVPALAIGALDRRAELEGTLAEQRLQDQDAYTSRRDLYLRARAAEIEALHGRQPRDITPSPAPR
ncbi:MlaA family lipoprotein [Novosphingobium pentaromativorans]|uniref:VacJ-like lipoprotein n=1 Tax=Novosphingobium pentaromativorans US6-1 TaxID=1088721 RepID=G6EDI3_9SPHN|nr:VacJ family lipoprotein [Novosphingobium pentaromativorans]EHJ60611.1 VacJ-like lipoprotein [Novosphingobium pentaromativorans US6-1]